MMLATAFSVCAVCVCVQCVRHCCIDLRCESTVERTKGRKCSLNAAEKCFRVSSVSLVAIVVSPLQFISRIIAVYSTACASAYARRWSATVRRIFTILHIFCDASPSHVTLYRLTMHTLNANMCYFSFIVFARTRFATNHRPQ